VESEQKRVSLEWNGLESTYTGPQVREWQVDNGGFGDNCACCVRHHYLGRGEPGRVLLGWSSHCWDCCELKKRGRLVENVGTSSLEFKGQQSQLGFIDEFPTKFWLNNRSLGVGAGRERAARMGDGKRNASSSRFPKLQHQITCPSCKSPSFQNRKSPLLFIVLRSPLLVPLELFFSSFSCLPNNLSQHQRNCCNR